MPGTSIGRVKGEIYLKDSWTSKLSRAQTRLGKFGASAQKSFGAISRVAKIGGLAIVGFAGLSVKAFGDFDAAMTKSLAIMDDTAQEMRGEMAASAREMAKTTVFSAKQAAESYFYLASAGYDAKEALAALPTVAQFAQAGMFDMATATDLLTDAQSALGLNTGTLAEKMENLGRVGDVLVKANTLANATVEQFATSLTREAGAAMKSFKMDVEEGVAVLAAFADQGVKGEIAGTGLSRILRLMTTAAVKNKQAYSQLGVEVFDASGNLNNMADIVEDLENALGHLSDAQRVAALAALGFKARVQGVILPLMGTSGAIREYEVQLRKAGGTSKKVSEKQLQTFNKQLGLLWAAITDVGISIGESLVGPLGLLVEKMKAWTGGAGGGSFVAWFRDSLPGAIEKTMKALKFLSRAVTGLRLIWMGATGGIMQAWDGMMFVIKASLAWIIDKSQAMLDIVAGLEDETRAKMIGMGASLAQIAPNLSAALLTVGTASEESSNALRDLGIELDKSANEHMDNVITRGDEMAQSYVDILEAQTAFDKGLDSLSDDLVGAAEVARDAAKAIEELKEEVFLSMAGNRDYSIAIGMIIPPLATATTSAEGLTTVMVQNASTANTLTTAMRGIPMVDISDETSWAAQKMAELEAAAAEAALDMFGLGAASDEYLAALGRLGIEIPNVGQMIDDLRRVAAEGALTNQEMAAAAQDLYDKLEKLGRLTPELGAELLGMGAELEKNTQQFDEFFKIIKTGTAWLDTLIEGVFRFISSLVSGGGLGESLGGIGQMISGVFGANGGSGIGDALGGILQNAGGGGGGGGIGDMLSGLFGGGGGGSFFGDAASAFSMGGEGLASSVGTGFLSKFGSVFSSVSNFVPIIGPFIGMLAGPMMKGVGMLIGKIKDMFGPSKEELEARDTVGAVHDQLVGMLSSSQLAEAGGEFWAQVNVAQRDAMLALGYSIEDVEAKWQEFADAATNPEAAAKMESFWSEKLGKVQGMMKESGLSMIDLRDRMSKAMRDGADSVEEAFDIVMDKVAKAAKETAEKTEDSAKDFKFKIAKIQKDLADALDKSGGKATEKVKQLREKLLAAKRAAKTATEKMKEGFLEARDAVNETRKSVRDLGDDLRGLGGHFNYESDYSDDTDGTPKIPGLAGGGIVSSPMLAMIAEREPEAVIPLSRLGGTGGGSYRADLHFVGGSSTQAAAFRALTPILEGAKVDIKLLRRG